MNDLSVPSAAARAERRTRAHRDQRRARTLVLALWFGFLGPALCFGLQRWLELDLFRSWELPVRVAAVIGVALLAAHLWEPAWGPRAAAILSGALAASSVQALLIGLLLLPYSVIALLAVLGVLGFVPFGTAWVLQRACQEALGLASSLPRASRAALGALGFALVALPPVGMVSAQELAYRTAFERLDSREDGSVERACDVLALVPWLPKVPLVTEAGREESDERFERLSRLYLLRFGEPIDGELLKAD